MPHFTLILLISLLNQNRFETTFDFFGERITITENYEVIDNESAFIKTLKTLVPRTIEEAKGIHTQLNHYADAMNLDDYGRLFLYIKFIKSIPEENTKTLYSLPEILMRKKINEPSGIVLLSSLLWLDHRENIILENESKILLGIPLTEITDLQGYFLDRNNKRYFLKDLSMLPPGELKNNIDLKMGFKITDFKFKGTPISPDFKRGLPLLKEGEKLVRKFGFVFNDQYYRFNAVLDSNLTKFSNLLPADFLVKTRFGVLEVEKLGLTGQLKEFIKKGNFTHLEKVNFLLSMTSQLFNYSESNIKSASKNLIDLANDCDARSTFFASLLISVLNYSPEDIIFLEFPGAEHAVVGVFIKTANPAEIEGTYITYNKKHYWICDTTYLIDGIARVGILHPDYEGKEIIIRPLR
jgi:hypothetical protein